jgi:outer membrane protein OmpU
MNKLKKIGLSALAGSLVATSAFAGEMAVGGTAKATWTDREAGTNTGNGIGMNKGLTFTGSGDLDSGHSIKFYTALNGTSRSSSSLTYDMGDLGSLTLDNGVGGHGIGSIDDKTPTANEEIWDNITNATESYLVGIGNNGALAYKTTLGSFTVSADYVKQGGGALEDGATGTAGTGSAQSFALTTTISDGFNVGVGMGDAGTANANNDAEQTTAFATYAMGGFTVGYQLSEEETVGANNWESSQWGVSFNVNDNISIGYGERTVDIAETAADQSDTGFSASYTMGSVSVKANINTSDDQNGTVTSDKETTEIAVSFAF